jgi:hypothetical protein
VQVPQFTPGEILGGFSVAGVIGLAIVISYLFGVHLPQWLIAVGWCILIVTLAYLALKLLIRKNGS